jgi:WD40 repeat protein
MRTCFASALVFWVSIAGVNAAHASDSPPCAALLAASGTPAASDDSPASPEAVMAAAWSELISKDRTLSDAEFTWLESVASGGAALEPEPALFDAATHEAIDQLRNTADALGENQRINLDRLHAEILARADDLVGKTNQGRQTEDESRAKRAETKTPVVVLNGHTEWVRSATFSPDGTRIVTASEDGTARVWDLQGKLLATLQGHTDWVYSASFSPDGTRIVTASRDQTARVWDMQGKLLATLQGHTDWVLSASFSPDGTRIVTASNDRTARVWDLQFFLDQNAEASAGTAP